MKLAADSAAALAASAADGEAANGAMGATGGASATKATKATLSTQDVLKSAKMTSSEAAKRLESQEHPYAVIDELLKPDVHAKVPKAE